MRPNSAVTIEHIVIIGDSLSDRGSMAARNRIVAGLSGVTSTPKGRFSDRYVWSDILALRLLEKFEGASSQRTEESDRLLLDPYRVSSASTGTLVRTFCEGGASARNYSHDFRLNVYLAATQKIVTTLEHLCDRLFRDDEAMQTSSTEKEKTLVIVWLGANDLLTLNNYPSMIIAAKAVDAHKLHLERMIYNGYRQFLFLGLPDLSQVPRFIQKTQAEKDNVQCAAKYFNEKLNEELSFFKKRHPTGNFLFYNPQPVFNEIMNNRESQYQRLNKEKPFIASESFKLGPSAAELYMYWDDVHITEVVHTIFTNKILGFLDQHIYFQKPLKTPLQLFRESYHACRSENAGRFSYSHTLGDVFRYFYATVNKSSGGKRTRLAMKFLGWIDDRGTLTEIGIKIKESAFASDLILFEHNRTLTDSAAGLNDTQLKNILSREGYRLQGLNVSGCYQLTQTAFIQVAKQCPILISLDMSGIKNLAELSDKKDQIRFSYCETLILRDSVNLKHIFFPGNAQFPKLRSLDVTGCSLLEDIEINTSTIEQIEGLNGCAKLKGRNAFQQYPLLAGLPVTTTENVYNTFATIIKNAISESGELDQQVVLSKIAQDILKHFRIVLENMRLILPKLLKIAKNDNFYNNFYTTDQHQEDKATAIKLLGYFGLEKEVLPVVLSRFRFHFTHSNFSVACIEAIGNFGYTAEGMQVLDEAFSYPSENNCFNKAAVKLLIQFGQDHALQVLNKLLQNRKIFSCVTEILEVFHQHPDEQEKIISYILCFLKPSVDWRWRRDAEYALAKIDLKHAVQIIPVLLDLLNEHDERNFPDIVFLLGKFGQGRQDVIDALMQIWQSRIVVSWKFECSIIKTLGLVGKENINVVSAIFQRAKKSSYLWESEIGTAIASLGQMNCQIYTEEIITFLLDRLVKLKENLCKSTLEIHGRGEAERERDFETMIVIEALSRLGQGNPRVTPVLLNTLKTRATVAAVKALRWVDQVHLEQAITVLLGRIYNAGKDYELIVDAIVETLSQFEHSDQLIDALLKKLGDCIRNYPSNYDEYSARKILKILSCMNRGNITRIISTLTHMQGNISCLYTDCTNALIKLRKTQIKLVVDTVIQETSGYDQITILGFSEPIKEQIISMLLGMLQDCYSEEGVKKPNANVDVIKSIINMLSQLGKENDLVITTLLELLKNLSLKGKGIKKLNSNIDVIESIINALDQLGKENDLVITSLSELLKNLCHECLPSKKNPDWEAGSDPALIIKTLGLIGKSHAAQLAPALWEAHKTIKNTYQKKIILNSLLSIGQEISQEIVAAIFPTLGSDSLFYDSLINLSRLMMPDNICQYLIELIKRYVHKQVRNSIPSISGALEYIKVPNDGSCLFHAVGMYLDDKDPVTILRRLVVEKIENNIEEYRPLISALNPGKTVEQYLLDLRNGVEWADNIELAVLMKLLNRPIVVIDPSGTIRNRSDLFNDDNSLQFSGDPIFVYYNAHNHYDALILKSGANARTIFNDLLMRRKSEPVTQRVSTNRNILYAQSNNRVSATTSQQPLSDTVEFAA